MLMQQWVLMLIALFRFVKQIGQRPYKWVSQIRQPSFVLKSQFLVASSVALFYCLRLTKLLTDFVPPLLIAYSIISLAVKFVHYFFSLILMDILTSAQRRLGLRKRTPHLVVSFLFFFSPSFPLIISFDEIPAWNWAATCDDYQSSQLPCLSNRGVVKNLLLIYDVECITFTAHIKVEQDLIQSIPVFSTF